MARRDPERLPLGGSSWSRPLLQLLSNGNSSVRLPVDRRTTADATTEGTRERERCASWGLQDGICIIIQPAPCPSQPAWNFWPWTTRVGHRRTAGLHVGGRGVSVPAAHDLPHRQEARRARRKPAGHDTQPPALIDFMMKRWKPQAAKLPKAPRHAAAFARRRAALSKRFPGEALVDPHRPREGPRQRHALPVPPGQRLLLPDRQPRARLRARARRPRPAAATRDVLFVEPNPGRTRRDLLHRPREGRAVGRPAPGRAGEPRALRRRRVPRARRAAGARRRPSRRRRAGCARAARALATRSTRCAARARTTRDDGARALRSPRCG